jgi:hypothetical protein
VNIINTADGLEHIKEQQGFECQLICATSNSLMAQNGC